MLCMYSDSNTNTDWEWESVVVKVWPSMFCFSVPAPGGVFIEVKDQPVSVSAASRAQPGSRHHDGINSRRRPNGAYTAYHQHWTLHARVTQAVLATLCSGAIPQSHMSCRNFSRPFCSCYPLPLPVYRTMFKCRSAVATSASKSSIRRFVIKEKAPKTLC